MDAGNFSKRANALMHGPSAGAWDIQRRAVELAERADDVIFLTVGDPDFSTPTAITERAIEALRNARTKYSPSIGEPALLEAAARHLSQRSGVAATSEQVSVFPGAQNALYNVFGGIAGPGDEVVVFDPFYPTYPGVVAASGAALRTAATHPDEGFAQTAQAVSAVLNERTRAVLVNSPCNPTGAVAGRDALQSLVQFCQQHDLWLVSDEVYKDYAFDEPHVSVWSLSEGWDKAVIVDSVSKSLAMSGWRIGWAVGHPELIRRMELINESQLFASPQFSQDAVAWALTHPQSEQQEFFDAFNERRNTVVRRVEQISGLRCSTPGGGMFAMVDVRQLDSDDVRWANALLDAAHVAVVPGSGFGPGAAGHVRISLTQPLPVLTEALQRIATFTVS